MIRHLRDWEEKAILLSGKMIPRSLPYLRRYQRLLRYLVAGGGSAAVDFFFLYLFTDVAGIHYLLSSVFAFLIAFVVSFILQKFWTFQDHSTDRVHMQAVAYFVVAGLNLLLNTLLMYLFVDKLHVWYLFAQFISSGLIACESFFISRYLFRMRTTDHPTEPPFRQRTDPPPAEKRGGGTDMKLLIITQKVEAFDSNLGFFISWIKKFSERAEVTVIANEVGLHDLEGIPVFSLGKEKGASRLVRLFRYRKLLFKLLPNVDGIFFHMCPEYVLAAKLLPKLFGKKSILWYTHKEVSVRLRIASWLVDKIYTASKESCRLRSKKIVVAGHGIDTELFFENPPVTGKLRLLSVGRIAPAKDLDTLIRGFFLFKEKYPDATLTLVGDAITQADQVYEEEMIVLGNRSLFSGPVPYDTLPSVYRDNTIFVHASRTGSLDKAVLEALAVGLPVFTSSEAFSENIPGVTKFEAGNPKDLAKKILVAFERGELGYNEKGREWVLENHNLNNLIKKIVDFYRV